MAILAGMLEVLHSDCETVAGKSTLDRVKLSREIAMRYHKVSHISVATEALSPTTIRNQRPPQFPLGPQRAYPPAGTVARFAAARIERKLLNDQDLALQLDALAKAGCVRVFQDKASGAKADRPGLTAALGFVREGDILTVWKLDRLGRSLPHLIDTVNALEARGVSFRSLTEAIDTTTPGGRLVFHIFGALGQFERDLIRERTRAGLDAAAARGRQGGRIPVMTDEKLRRAQRLLVQGLAKDIPDYAATSASFSKR